MDVSEAVLSKIVEYLKHHQGVDPGIPEKPLRSKIMKEVCSQPWDAEFIDKIGESRQHLYEVILVSIQHVPLRNLEAVFAFSISVDVSITILSSFRAQTT